MHSKLTIKRKFPSTSNQNDQEIKMSRSSTANNVICGRLPLFCRLLKRCEKNYTNVLSAFECGNPRVPYWCGTLAFRVVKNSISIHKMSLFFVVLCRNEK